MKYQFHNRRMEAVLCNESDTQQRSADETAAQAVKSYLTAKQVTKVRPRPARTTQIATKSK